MGKHGEFLASAFIVDLANACAIALMLVVFVYMFVGAGGGEYGQSFRPTDWRSVMD